MYSKAAFERNERILCLAAILLTGASCAPSGDAGKAMAPTSVAPKSDSAQPRAQGAAACREAAFDSCLNSGKALLQSNPELAQVAFKQALALAAQEDDAHRIAEAYAQISQAKSVLGDGIAALAYLERAQEIAPGQADIASRLTRLRQAEDIASAEDIERKLSLDKEIVRNESDTSAAVEAVNSEVEEAVNNGVSQGGAPHYATTSMKNRRSFALLAMLDSKGEYKQPSPHGSASKRKLFKPKERPTISHRLIEYDASSELRVNFEYNSARLTTSGASQVSELGKALERIRSADPGARFMLLGHTDMFGNDRYNLALSRKRAESVKRQLLSERPALSGALEAEGMGRRQMLSEASDEESQRLNRRVEVVQLR